MIPPLLPGERRAIVHIGLNKTGSASIQAWLALNRAGLAAQGVQFDPLQDGAPPKPLAHVLGFGCLGPALAGRVPRAPHIRLAHDIGDDGAWALRELEFRGRAEASMARMASGTYAISSEWLAQFVNRTAHVGLLDAWLGARFDRVFYLAYLRDQVAWVTSAYGQHVREGGTQSLDEFVADRGAQDYHTVVNRWLLVAGRDRMAVRLLEPDCLTGGDLIADYAGLLGADTAPLSPVPRANEALSAASLHALLAVNREAALLPPDQARALRRIAILREKQRPAGPRLHLGPQQQAQVAALNALSNEKLRKALFPQRPALFGRPDTGPPEPHAQSGEGALPAAR